MAIIHTRMGIMVFGGGVRGTGVMADGGVPRVRVIGVMADEGEPRVRVIGGIADSTFSG